jgi:oxygen-dependent protoporphyrinogen oxidase
MIGRLHPGSRPEDRNVTIIGAGISGLLIGHVLKKKGWKVRILEKTHRVGGLIDTPVTEFGPSETAAHSLMITPELKEFFDELGVELQEVAPDSRSRYIYRNGRMRRYPLTILETLKTLLRFLSRPQEPLNIETATLADWCSTYLGKPALRFLLAPFVTGVFAASPEELDLSTAFPSLVPADPRTSLFKNLFRKRRKKSRRPQMMTPRRGMLSVIDRLYIHLKDEIELNADVDSLPDVPNLILAVPAPELARLIAPHDPESSRKLQAVRYSPLITSTVFLDSRSFNRKPPRGVGVLIPRNEGLRILGVLFNSSSFSGRSHSWNMHSYTVMVGGTADPEALDLSDPALSELISRDLDRLFDLNSKPALMATTRWKAAIPVYSKELKDARASLEAGFCQKPGRMVFTNFSKDVSIRGLIQSLLEW